MPREDGAYVGYDLKPLFPLGLAHLHGWRPARAMSL